MKQLLFTLSVLGTLAFTPLFVSASHSTSYPDRHVPNDLVISPTGDEVLLAQRCYRPARNYGYYGPRSFGPGYYPSYRSLRPYGYGYGGAAYRGYGGFGRYSARYGNGPRAGVGLYIGF